MLKLRNSLLSHTALASVLGAAPVLMAAAIAGTFAAGDSALAASCIQANTGGYSSGTYGGATNAGDCDISSIAPVIQAPTGGGADRAIYVTSGKTFTILSDLDTVLNSADKGWMVSGITTKYNGSVIDASGKKIKLEIINANNVRAGIDVSYDSMVKVGSFDVTMSNLPRGGFLSPFEHYGVLAGSSVNAGDNSTTNNGKYSRAEFDNLTVKMGSTQSGGTLLAGIRAIQGAGENSGNGTSGYVEVHEDLLIDIEGNSVDSVGIYVSGGDSQVHLNNSHIKIKSNNNRANAILLGKTREIGTGIGKLYSNGHMVLDTSASARGSTISIIEQGALLDANADASSTEIKSANIAINISGSADASGQVKTTTSFNNLVAGTVSNTANLINVGTNMSNYELNVRGLDSELTAAAGGWLLNVAGGATTPSLTNFNFSEGSMYGLVNKTAASELNLNIDNGAVWNLQEKSGSTPSSTSTFTSLELLNGSQINAFGDFTLAGNINSANGILNLSDGNAGDQLTLQGNYDGNEGALLILDTFLGGSGSLSDRLVNDGGTISGSTLVRINNTDPADAGAETDPGHGIKVVRSINGGTTDDDAFALDKNAANAYEFNGRTVVGAGAYAYGLYKGANPSQSSVTDDYDEADLENDWYLRSQLDKVDPVDPVDPQYTAGVPIYEAYPQLLLGLNSLPTLQQRVGNRYWNNAGNKVISQGADVVEVYAPSAEAGVLIEQSGIWGRIEGSHTKIKSRVSTSGTDYDYNTFKMQAGLDGMLSENEDGKLIGGVTVHYAHGKANISSAHGDGDIKTNGYGFGGTLTWYGENGFYVDNQAQLTWYDSDLNSDTAERSLVRGNNGFGYALSIETGKRITIDENWSVTPQAQLMYSNVRFDSFTDQFNGHVSKKRADSLQGRLGISADYQNSWLNDQGMINRSYVYGIANLYNEFLNGTKVDVSGVSFTNKRERLWAGIGLGGSYNWNDDKYSVYGEGSVNTSLKNFGDSYSYKGTVGFRVKW